MIQQLIALLTRLFGGGANGSASQCTTPQPSAQLPNCSTQMPPAAPSSCAAFTPPGCANGAVAATSSSGRANGTARGASSVIGANGSQPPVQVSQNTPSGTLKVNGNTVTTPGGYQIVPTKQYEWKIVGPDGTSSRIYGDPHVDVGSNQAFDIQGNSTFTLPDGTNIDVNTKPYVNSLGKVTPDNITSSLDITNGADHVNISGIDQGAGTAGSTQTNGQQVQSQFKNNPDYVMGQEANQWSQNGRPVTTHVMATPAKTTA
jgi:hypothetical protein